MFAQLGRDEGNCFPGSTLLRLPGNLAETLGLDSCSSHGGSLCDGPGVPMGALQGNGI